LAIGEADIDIEINQVKLGKSLIERSGSGAMAMWENVIGCGTGRFQGSIMFTETHSFCKTLFRCRPHASLEWERLSINTQRF
jgi:hypothetical protein